MQGSNKIIHFPQDIKTLALKDRGWNPVKFQNPTSFQALQQPKNPMSLHVMCNTPKSSVSTNPVTAPNSTYLQTL
jgi:hypothetical protein